MQLVLLAVFVVFVSKSFAKIGKFDNEIQVIDNSAIKVFVVSGPKVLRHGKDYKFTAVASDLQRSLIVNFVFSGSTTNGDNFEYKWKQTEISNRLKTFVLKVRRKLKA